MQESEQAAQAQADDFDPNTGEVKEQGPLLKSTLSEMVLGKSPERARFMVDPRKLAEKFGGVPFHGNKKPVEGSEPAPGEEPIKWISSSDLEELASQPINWAVKELYTERARVVIAAEQKSGKTFLVSHLAIAVASGTSFLGAFQIEKRGPVLIIAGEDDAREIARRMSRMCRPLGLRVSDLPIYFGDAHGARLNRPFEIEIVKKKVQETKAVLVIADPLARLMEGDENSKECIAQVLNPAGKLADKSEFGTSFCFVHHLGKPGDGKERSANRVRGSSDIASWFTCGIFLSGSMDDRLLQLEVIQRTSGNLPHKFSAEVLENAGDLVYGRPSMKLVARLDEDDSDNVARNTEGENERCSDQVYALLREEAHKGATTTEIQTRLKMSAKMARVALERLLVQRKSVVKRKNPTGIDRDRFYLKQYAPPEGEEPTSYDIRPIEEPDFEMENDLEQPELPF